MARLVWIGVGAVGGVYAYRKGEQLVDAVRGQGVAGTAQLVAATTLQAVGGARARQSGGPAGEPAAVAPAPGAGLRVGRFRITRADEAPPGPPAAPAAIMDTGVIDITDARGRSGTQRGPAGPGAARRRKAR